MNAFKSVLTEILGLFVDDGSFALAILVWLGLVWFLFRRLQLPLPGGILLFFGLAAILAESVIRASRNAARKLPSDAAPSLSPRRTA